MTITLNVSTNQEAFDKVWKHLHSMPRRAAQYDVVAERMMCRFRTELGERCAVGCLIPDDQYDPAMEVGGVGTLVDEGWLDDGMNAIAIELLMDLQDIHDEARNWDESGFNGSGTAALRHIAKWHALTTPEET